MSSMHLGSCRPRHVRTLLATGLFVGFGTLLSGCGGGSSPATSDTASTAVRAEAAGSWSGSTSTTATPLQAWRVLTQGTFGPTSADMSSVKATGVTAWIDAQLAKPHTPVYYTRFMAEDAAIKAKDPLGFAGPNTVYATFYTQAMTADDQLRQRVGYALSQIFVISTLDINGWYSPAAASYMDMLNRNAFGNFRTLLEDVARHPAMGEYLSHRANKKEDPKTGRIPDENFAREVMQLFSIGVVQLRQDGSVKTDANGKPIETYGPEDVAGLAKVFTGFSWGGPDQSDQRFYGSVADPNRYHLPMQGYPKFHSISEKRFLGKVIPATTVADPDGDMKIALDTLFNHANTPPFIARQLIQRLVTSSPSPGYVKRVADAFKDNGQGVRGDMKHVVRTLLLDNEARNAPPATNLQRGKLREPVLRLTALLRAFNATSDSGRWLIWRTEDPGTQLAQTPLRATTVFNFYRPGYVMPESQSGAAGMTVPELQLVDEASVAGVVNWFNVGIRRGFGARGEDGLGTRPDVQLNLTEEYALVGDARALVDKVYGKVAGEVVSKALKDEAVAAVDSIVIPTLNRNATNQWSIDKAKTDRVVTAVLMIAAAHETFLQR